MASDDDRGFEPVPAVSVVMPAHNEQGYLEPAVVAVVDGLRQRGLAFEVVVAENGSQDGTAAEADQVAKAYLEVRVLRLPTADYGLALRAGFEAAAGEVVVNFDVDQVDLGFLDQAVEVMGPGRSAPPVTRPAIVVGSKRSPGATDHRRVGRKVVTAVFSLLLRYVFGLRVSDTHGLKALDRDALAPLVARCRFGADIFDTELVLRAERAGLAVIEVPVTVSDQRPPRTPIVRRIPRSLLGLGRLRVALWQERHGL